MVGFFFIFPQTFAVLTGAWEPGGSGGVGPPLESGIHVVKIFFKIFLIYSDPPWIKIVPRPLVMIKENILLYLLLGWKLFILILHMYASTHAEWNHSKTVLQYAESSNTKCCIHFLTSHIFTMRHHTAHKNNICTLIPTKYVFSKDYSEHKTRYNAMSQ